MSDEVRERNKTAIKEFLNAEKVKLWLKPYTNDDESKNELTDCLITEIYARLNIPKNETEEIVEELRIHSLRKYKASVKFKETGIATLALKVVSSTQARNNVIPKDDNDWIEVSLNSCGNVLKRKLSEKLMIESQDLKLICSGHNIEDEITLEQQNIKNLSSILVLCLNNDERINFQESEHECLIGRAKKAAKLMNNRKFFDLELTDQKGKALDIPKEEKKALSVAMMLHEKGRSCMKKKNYGLALVYLLEADSEFTKCNSEILNVVDNFALLSLDIVWCYYSLQQISNLPDAERRLALCDEKFKETYGANMERVMMLRGGSCKELAVIVRLHLMQGVIYFIKGMYNKSLELLDKTESELKSILVDEQAMLSLMEMGFSETKARLALRFCRGDVAKAIEHIMSEKKEKEMIKNEELQKKKNTTDGGHPLDNQLLQYLISMGFSENASRRALKKKDNDLSSALESLSTPSVTSSNNSSRQLTLSELNQLVALGFDGDTIRDSIEQCHTLADATAVLRDKIGEMNGTMEQALISVLHDLFSGRNSEFTEDDKELIQGEMLDDIRWSKDDYLDIVLDEETSILEVFKVKLSSLGYNN